MRGSTSKANLKHVFISGQRVTFDRRDDSVTLFPDEGFRFIGSQRIGTATGFGRDWTATAPDGKTRSLPGRKAAAEWLIEHTRDDREHDRLESASKARQESLDAEAVTEIIRSVRPNYRQPGPFMDDPNAGTFFVFEPSELLDLMRDLIAAAESTSEK